MVGVERAEVEGRGENLRRRRRGRVAIREDEHRARRFGLGEVRNGDRRFQEAKHLRTGERGL